MLHHLYKGLDLMAVSGGKQILKCSFGVEHCQLQLAVLRELGDPLARDVYSVAEIMLTVLVRFD